MNSNSACIGDVGFLLQKTHTQSPSLQKTLLAAMPQRQWLAVTAINRSVQQVFEGVVYWWSL